MFKKQLLTPMLLLLMVNMTQAQNNQDLTNYIESQKEDIENSIKLSKIQLEVKPIEVEGFNPNDKNNFHSRDVSAFDDKDSLKNLIKELTSIYVEVMEPYSLVEFHFDDDTYAEFLGEFSSLYLEDRPEELPFYEPIEIRFQDGKTQKVKEKEYVNQRLLKGSVNENDPKAGLKLSDLEKHYLEEPMYSGIDQVGFYTSKPIESIAVKVTITTPEYSSYRLTQNGEVAETPEGKIELVGISGNQLAIKFPATLQDRYTVLPLYEDGRVLKEQSSSLKSGYGVKAIPKLLKVLGLYDQALSEVKKGNLNSTDKIDAFMEVRATKNKLTITEEEQVAEKRQTLRGPISEVIFKVKKEKLRKQTFTFEMAEDTYE